MSGGLKLRSGLRTMARERHRALADRELPEPARKLMQSMQRHWRGLREFVHHENVPPENNAAERALRAADFTHSFCPYRAGS